jgi:prevent-host-death family protein
MRTISQRELRNDNAAIVRGVEEGESYTITRRGVPVARLVPLTSDTDLRCDRPAKRQPTYSKRRRVTASMSTRELLGELRDER